MGPNWPWWACLGMAIAADAAVVALVWLAIAAIANGEGLL